MTTILVKCMQGIGDQIYARPFVKLLAQDYRNEIYIDTVLPDLFCDIDGLKYIESVSAFRTQKKNLDRSSVRYSKPLDKYDRVIDCYYGQRELGKHGIISHLENAFEFDLGSNKIDFSLPYWPGPSRFLDSYLSYLPELGLKKIAIIRPVTLRKEWFCASRSPDPNYINWCARILKDSGYFVISIADCAEGEEWIDGELPFAHEYLHEGELGLLATLSLFQRAEIVVGGSGFIIPAAISANTNLFVIFGGRGEYDNPHKVFDLRLNMKKIGWALPDRFCRCNKMNHDCDKTISDLDDQFFKFMGTL